VDRSDQFAAGEILSYEVTFLAAVIDEEMATGSRYRNIELLELEQQRLVRERIEIVAR
jgi:hypothetical protein